MLRLLFALIFALAGSAVAATAQLSTRDIPNADQSLRRAVSAKIYHALRTAPVKGWVVARGRLEGNRVTGSRIVRSDLAAAYDSVALELAGNLHILGDTRGETPPGGRNVRVQLLLYDIADGRLAVSFATFDDPDTAQWSHYGGAWMAVHKANNTWVPIDLPHFSPHERRGPRTYTLGIQQPGARRLSFLPDVGWHRRFNR